VLVEYFLLEYGWGFPAELFEIADEMSLVKISKAE